MTTIDFKYGSLIRTGPKLVDGGKWDAELNEDVRDTRTNADLTIMISVYFMQINPAGGKKTGLYGDTDDTPAKPSKRKIQTWNHGEFDQFKRRLLRQAQDYWSGKFWLQTPADYRGLDFPESRATHRCNLYCRLELTDAPDANSAHYTIAVVRAADGENFRSNSRLYSQHDIQAENLIPHSTTKFWTHFHEVGHLLGLGHVNHRDLYQSDGLNLPAAYGVGGTLAQQQDVMGMGSVRHPWHADPWQQAAATFTDTKKSAWQVHTIHILPAPLGPTRPGPGR